MNLTGTKLNFSESTAGKAVDFVKKAGKETGDGAIVMWVGVKTDKTTGEMKGQLQSVRNDTLFKKMLNFLKGRQVASDNDILKHFATRGMNTEDSHKVLSNITMASGQHYVAKSFEQELSTFDQMQRQARIDSGKFSENNGKYF